MRRTVEEILSMLGDKKTEIVLSNGKRIEGVFTEYRVSRENIPEGKYLYDIRHSDNDWCEPATLEPSVLVNWLGTIILDEPITFPDGKFKYYEIEKMDY